ncbi:MAG: hypothetical protein IT445_12800 [Phycisphaeraceae bacterium]|nr:hypothetical protein [Phycisphaeraceae bacterium]
MTNLKDLVQQRIDVQWDDWSQRHPNLAAAIDRVRLTDSVVDRLRSDPAYVSAMQEASLDENQLLAALRVLETIERLVKVALPLL